MTRLNKYMVFNPKEDKPKKFFSYRKKALKVAKYMRNKYKTDFLVLKVDYIAQYPKTFEEKFEEVKVLAKKMCEHCSCFQLKEPCNIKCENLKIKEIVRG